MRCAALLLALCVASSSILGLHAADNLRVLLPRAKESKDFVSLKMGQAFNFLKDQEDENALQALDLVMAELDKLKELINTVDSMEEEEEEAVTVFEKLVVNVTQTAECEEKTQVGDTVAVHYVSKIATSMLVVDSSFHTGSIPISLEIGNEDNMPSWNEGLVGMCAGERRTVGAPAEMAYGEFGLDDRIAPNTDMVFDFQLLDFQTSRYGATKTIRPSLIAEEDTPLEKARKEYEAEKAKREEERNKQELENYAKRKADRKEANKGKKKKDKKKKTKKGEEL
mmetsp:Transcript_7053/g.8097  ORF Transcript_7053/g.8097 Transcript_7053/m.8097 type:complete len:282 (-) Transcript_7053:251-1096(-)|eukprot:CAMPEP_0197854300 /NCGR_PEP_ID=MMETSP1438-20131217/24426_1 /TAXON_ID=1461541 /ORGANISM="Pterosperma sp., Strain CCMP1384" /LENGTH=281 /DNA_ID=CAMNT_0043468997 /DNA_START=171 /DNA_END=1016 /DNA_ORIENTATION=-